MGSIESKVFSIGDTLRISPLRRSIFQFSKVYWRRLWSLLFIMRADFWTSRATISMCSISITSSTRTEVFQIIRTYSWTLILSCIDIIIAFSDVVSFFVRNVISVCSNRFVSTWSIDRSTCSLFFPQNILYNVYPWHIYHHDDITFYAICAIGCPSTPQAWKKSTLKWWDISEMGLSVVIICIVTDVSIVTTSYPKRVDKYLLLFRVFLSYLFVRIKIFGALKNFHNMIS